MKNVFSGIDCVALSGLGRGGEPPGAARCALAPGYLLFAPAALKLLPLASWRLFAFAKLLSAQYGSPYFFALSSVISFSNLSISP
jgi:hypothetical protein